MARIKGPRTESYQLFDFLHDASQKTSISIITELGLETLQTRREEQQTLIAEEQKGEHGEREEPDTAEQADTTGTQ